MSTFALHQDNLWRIDAQTKSSEMHEEGQG